MKTHLTRAVLAIATGLVVAAGCSSNFTPKNEVNSVRILASKADLPYAKPGEQVHLEVLAHDGRPAPVTEPMRMFWFPAPCVNPPGGQYYACYLGFDALFPIGVDLTPYLHEGNDVTVKIPDDALSSAVVQKGQGERFGTAFVFMVACPGHVERVPIRGGLAPNAVPIGCINARGEQLPADQFVFGFTRIYVFDDRRNTIPTLDGLMFQGKPVDPKVGIVTGHCTSPDDNETCKKKVSLDVTFNDNQSETDPDNIDSNNNVGKETLYVDWFTSVGRFAGDRKVLYDGQLGRTPKSAIDFNPPTVPVKGTVWAVFHDNRGGTSWLEIPIDVQ